MAADWESFSVPFPRGSDVSSLLSLFLIFNCSSTTLFPGQGQVGGGAAVMVLDSSEVFMDQGAGESIRSSAAPSEAPEARKRRSDSAKKVRQVPQNGLLVQPAGVPSVRGVGTPRPLFRRPLSLEMAPQQVRRSQDLVDRRPLQPPWRSGTVAAPSPPTRSLTSPSLGSGGAAGWMRRSESTCSVNHLRSSGGRMRPATSLPHIARGSGVSSLPAAARPCLLVALRPLNLEQEKHKFFESNFSYEPQFEYMQPEPRSVLEKYCDGSGLFLEQVEYLALRRSCLCNHKIDSQLSVHLQAVGIMECVLRKFGSYENFEEVTGGSVLPKSQVWAAVRKYLQKEGCTGEVSAVS